MQTIVLVHGAWHGAWCWEHLTPLLDAAGVPHREIDLPLSDHLDDVKALTALLDSVEGRKVLVGHSYGGLVVSGAAVGRADVGHLVYLCALMVEAGATAVTDLEGLPHTGIVDAIVGHEDGSTSIDPDRAPAVFYGGVPPEEARAAVGRLRPMRSSLLSESLGSPWLDVPSTYVLCERDGAIHPEAQRRMATRARSTVTLDSDHSPFLSMPDRVAELLVARAGDRAGG